MPASGSQSLASRRERRQAKPTARVQQMLDKQQARIEREEKAKEKAKEQAVAASRAALINNEGDDLMYGPAESYIPPTLTGDDDVDRQRFDAADAKHIIQLLAHRGDGDWFLHYRQGKIGLPLLREARDYPGAKIIERALGELAIPSAKDKGKGRAIDSLDHDDIAVESGQRATIYSGVTYGKLTPEPPNEQGKSHQTPFGPPNLVSTGNRRPTPRLAYPPAASPAHPPANVKRQAAFDNVPPPAKKSRVAGKGLQKPSVPSGPVKPRVAPATAPGKPKAPPPTTSYGKAATSLKVVTFGSEGWAPVIPNRPEPGKPTPDDHERHPDPPQPPNPRPTHVDDDNDNFAPAAQLPIPPLTQPVRSRPKPKNPWADPVIDYVPQPPPWKRAATSATRDKNLPRHQPPSPADPKDRLDAAHDETGANVRQPATTNKDGAARTQVNKQRADKQQLDKQQLDRPRADKPRADKPRLDKPRLDKPRLDKPRLDKPWPGAYKPQADKPRVDKPRVDKPRVDKPRVDKPRVDKPRVDKPRVDKPRVDKPRANEPLADKPRADRPRADKPRADIPWADKPQVDNPRVAKPRPGEDQPRADKPRVNKPRPDKSRTNKPQVERPRASKPKPQVDAPQFEHEAPANNRTGKARPPPPTRKKQRPIHRRQVLTGNARRARCNHRNRAASEDEEDDGQDERGGYMTDEDYEEYRRGPNLRSSDRPTVESFKPSERRTVKLMVRKAKPWIIACGTFSWRVDDPGDKVPAFDNIVAECFAIACREHDRRFVFQTDHVICVKSLITTYRTSVKDSIVPLVERVIGFVAADKRFNRKLVRWLLPDAFHEALPEAIGDRHPFEAEFLFMVVACVLFGPGNLGINQAARFNPVPIRFLAFLCAMCNHVIYCWHRGSFNRGEHLRSTVQEAGFQEYLWLLVEMQQARPYALRELCASMYDNARAEAEEEPIAPPVARQARQWAADIEDQYVPRYAAPVPERDNSTDQDDDGVGSDQPGYDQGVYLYAPDDSAHTDLLFVGCRDQADDLTDYEDERSGPRPQVEDEDVDDDDDNHGEGPSRPYGARTYETSDEENIPGWESALSEQLEPSDEEMDAEEH